MFIIDVESYAKARLIAALRRLKTTVSVADGGVYREDKNFSQVHLTTTLTLAEVEAWTERVAAAVGVAGVVEAKDE